MDTFGDVLKAAMLKAGADVFFEELEEMLEDSLLGVIFENFTVKAIQDMIFECLEDAHDRLDIDGVFSECKSRSRGVDLELVLGPDGFSWFYDIYESLREGGLLDSHPRWRYAFDEDSYYAEDYLDLEESEHTDLKRELNDIAERLINNDRNRYGVLQAFFGTKDPQKVKGNFAEMVADALGQVRAFSEICEEVGKYEFGFLTECDEFEDSEYALEVVRRMLRAAPEQFALNTHSTWSSGNGVRLYNSEFFEGRDVPEHLRPWAYLQDAETDPVQWLEACKEAGARTAVPSTVYTQLLETYEKDLLGFDAVVYEPRANSSSSISVPDNCTLIIHTRAFLENLNQYDFLENFMSPEQGLESTVHYDALQDAVLEGIQGRVDKVLWFVGQDMRSNLALPATADISSVYVNSGFSEVEDYLDPTFGFGDGTSVYARIPNSAVLKSGGMNYVRSLYVDDLVVEFGGLRLDADTLTSITERYPAVALPKGRKGTICLDTITDDVTVVASFDSDFSEAYKFCVRGGGNVTAVRRLTCGEGFESRDNRIHGFDEFRSWDVSVYTDCDAHETPLQSEDILRYFGWQNAKSMYKNSNFMAYSYTYMFLFQILGRFGEHVQSDVASQTLPLGAMFEVYFEKDPPQNPRQFLERVRDLLMVGRHPLIPPTTSYGFGVTTNNCFTNSYIAALQLSDVEPYGSPLRFLYSFIDTYTKPLAILYNAIQFGAGPRSNPELRSSKTNLTSSYPLNYSDGSWVREYLQSIFESQGAEFSQASLLREGMSPEKDQVLQELARFTEHAEVKEYFEIQALWDTLDMLKKDTAGAEIEYPAAMRKRASGLVEILEPLMNDSNMRSRSDFKQKAVFDLEGGFDMSPFSQQLVEAITFFSKFTSLAMGPFIVGLEDSKFYNLFLRGDSSPQAPVKNSADLRDLLKFPVVTSGIRKIVRNKDVASVIGAERTRLPFTRANLSKNLVPLDLIRYLISDVFPDTYTFTPMGMDARAKLPSTERLSLGAYVSTFTSLIHANKTFLGLQSADQYGAAQAVLSSYSVDFDDLRSESGEVDLSDFTHIVRQATADVDVYDDEGALSPASAETIKERFRNLSAAYSICIGQTQSYAEAAAKEELEVFTFFEGDTNVSTLGFSLKGEHNGTYEYTIEDSNGQNNSSCSSFGPEAAQFIINWLADTVLTYTISEDDLTAILEGDQGELPTAEIDFVLNDRNVQALFETCAAYTDSPVGFCTRLSSIFENFTVEQIAAATPILAEIDFFKYLLESRPEVSADVRQSLYSNKLSAYSKPMFRAVK